MRIGVPKESVPGEARVALVPAAVAPLLKAGLQVAVEQSAGEAAGFPDAAYSAQGASVLEHVKHSVQDFTRTAASQTSKAASAVASQSQNLAHQAAEQAGATFRSAQTTVQKRPMESILACFGVGLITGIAVSLLMRSHNGR